MIGCLAMAKAVFTLPCRFAITSYAMEARVKCTVEYCFLDWPISSAEWPFSNASLAVGFRRMQSGDEFLFIVFKQGKIGL